MKTDLQVFIISEIYEFEFFKIHNTAGLSVYLMRICISGRVRTESAQEV